MKIHNVEQKADEWFELRWGKVTGTDAEKVMSNTATNKKAVLFDLMSQHTNSFYDEPENDFTSSAMDHGNEYEPEARELLNQVVGVQLNEVGFVERNKFHGDSPDGLSEDLKVSCEIKCPQRKAFEQYLYDNNSFTQKYLWQVVNRFSVNDKCETVHLFAYSPSHMFRNYVLLTFNREDLITYKVGRAEKENTFSELAEMLNSKVDELAKIVTDHLETLEF